jgi:hypothetical protein
MLEDASDNGSVRFTQNSSTATSFREIKKMAQIARSTIALTIVLVLLAMTTSIPQATAASCLEICDAQFETCKKGCTSGNADTCIPSCFRGYEGCKKRCGTSSENLSLPDDAVRLGSALDGTSQWFDSDGSPGKVIRVCVQPPVECGSNGDCTCSHCCAPFGAKTVCQPSC